MKVSEPRVDQVLRLVATGASVLLAVLVALHIFAAAHPTGVSPALLPLSLAVVGATSTTLLQSPAARRVLLAFTSVSIATAFWMLLR